MIQPHVKLINVLKLNSYKEKMDFIRFNRNDGIFMQLLILLLSPEYKFNIENKLNFKLKSMITAPTNKTFGKFRTFLYKLEGDSSRVDELKEYLETLDAPTAHAYSIVANREDIGITFNDIINIIGKDTQINNNEYYINFGFPEFPCYVQEVDESDVRVNIRYTFGVANLTTLDNRRIINSTELQEELDKLYVSDDYWLNGYIKDDMLYILDYYFNSSVKFSERFIELEKLISVNTFKKIKLIKTYKVHNLHEFQYVVKNVSTPNILCRYDTVPSFGKESSNNIMLLAEKLRKL